MQRFFGAEPDAMIVSRKFIAATPGKSCILLMLAVPCLGLGCKPSSNETEKGSRPPPRSAAATRSAEFRPKPCHRRKESGSADCLRPGYALVRPPRTLWCPLQPDSTMPITGNCITGITKITHCPWLACLRLALTACRPPYQS
jgi:hypothetical protein